MVQTRQLETKSIRDRLYDILEDMTAVDDTVFTVAKTMKGVAAPYERWIIRVRPVSGRLDYKTVQLYYDNPQQWIIEVFSPPLGEDLYTVKEDRLYAYRDLLVDTFKPRTRLQYRNQVLHGVDGMTLTGERWAWGASDFDGQPRYKYELTVQIRTIEPC